MPIPLQKKIIYGPIRSRRFGQSLGINLLPVDGKLCSFDCIYCQYGETVKDKTDFPEADEVREVFLSFLNEQKELSQGLDWIMIAGNGEPTLHPQFGKIIETLVDVRDTLLPKIPIGILSNSSTAYRPEIRHELLKLDGRFMKLDAGSRKDFVKINRPAVPAQWDRIISGLIQLRPMVVQSLFVTGVFDNTTDESVGDWVRMMQYVGPEAVQIYTVDRPPSVEGVKAVDSSVLHSIAARLRAATPIETFVF